MNTQSNESTPIIQRIEKKLASIDSELSVVSAVKAVEGMSGKIDERIEHLSKTRIEFHQMLTIEKQRSVFETESATENTVFH